jgi:hypothetical protein
MLKKSLLALAVAGLSANAFASVNLDSDTPSVPTFASEIKIDTTSAPRWPTSPAHWTL